MLSCDERAELAAALCATAETLGHTISASAAKLMAEDLSEYSTESIANALKACRKELKGKLTLAAVLERIDAADGRPDPNEAWAIALAASDERNTAVMTVEIQKALSACASVLNAGDKVGARMSFLAAYSRFVDEARRAAVPAKWTVSLGHDSSARVSVIEEAGRLGRLPAPEVRELISRLSFEPVSEDGCAIAGLLSGEVKQASAGVREKLSVIRDLIKDNSRKRQEAREARLKQEREALERSRERQIKLVEAITGGANA